MKTLRAKDVMNTNVLTVNNDMTVHELALFFTENMISGAPVVDEAGKLLGVVSLSDIVRNDDRRSRWSRISMNPIITCMAGRMKSTRKRLIAFTSRKMKN
ncbi:MAG: CBS domain-containing protein, partial [bacterium]